MCLSYTGTYTIADSQVPIPDLDRFPSIPPCLEIDRSCCPVHRRIFSLEFFFRSASLHISTSFSIKPEYFFYQTLLKKKKKLLSLCIVKIGILNNTVRSYPVLIMMCLCQLLDLNPLNILWALMYVFFLILSFKHLSRKCTKDVSWHRDLEFQQK